MANLLELATNGRLGATPHRVQPLLGEILRIHIVQELCQTRHRQAVCRSAIFANRAGEEDRVTQGHHSTWATCDLQYESKRKQDKTQRIYINEP